MSDPFDLDNLVAPPAPAAPAPAAPAPVVGGIAAAAMAAAPAAAPAPYLDALNAEQRSAVEALDGPVLVLAGAGTGKTRVLTTRLSHLIHTGRAYPSQVLAVTFTNKAAREMINRVSKLLDRPADGLWLGTFHSIAARILRRHAELVGLRSDFSILDTDDQTRLLKQLLQARNIDDKRWPARALCTIIQRWKDRGLSPERANSLDGGDFANGEAPEIFAEYQARLRVLNATDFGDLLTLCIKLFQENPDVLTEYHSRFRYILVDEYQDTNVAQYLWLRLLAQREPHNICCVGDDDQSIYGWRGAEVGNILRFEKDFPGATVVRLERNYRSTGNILAAASGLIAKNSGRLGKTLWTEDAAGAPVRVSGAWDGDEEARIIGEEIEALQRNSNRLDQSAVLVRASFQTRAFEERFLTIGMPYRVIGGPRFYERQEVRDAVSYIRVLSQPDDDLAFERIVNTPKRGLGDASVQLLHQLARSKNISLHAAAAQIIETDELKAAARTSLANLLEAFSRWRALLNNEPHWEVLGTMLDESGYTTMWQNDKSPQAPGRLENLKELVAALEDFDNFGAFLEHVGLVMDREEGRTGGAASDDMVNIMTLHAAKGLEFDSVFLPGWEEGLFPHQLALDEQGSNGLEEERRLAYVGLTRARKRAQILFAANRRIYNQWVSAIPSRFIDELPPENVEADPAKTHNMDAESGASAGGRGGLEWSAPPRFENARGRTGTGGSGGSSGGSSSGGFGSPGGRNKFAGKKRTRQIDATSWSEEKPVKIRTNKGRYSKGDRVKHAKFGPGTVREADGDKLEIMFDTAGRKKVVDRFVESA
jgi:DNA helicase II / ATP-dependent DNA helicase PcrA